MQRVQLKRDYFGPGGTLYKRVNPTWGGYTEIPAGVPLPKSAVVLPEEMPEPAPAPVEEMTAAFLDVDRAAVELADAVVAKADADVAAQAKAFRTQMTEGGRKSRSK